MDLQNNAVSSAPKAKKSSVIFGFSKMFKFSFKQNLICLLLSVVVFACVFPVRAVIMMQDTTNYDYYDSIGLYVTLINDREERLKEIFSKIFDPNGGAVFALTLIIALFFSIVMFSYLHNKKAVNFYHSLPVKREAHLLSSVAVSAAYYFISLFSCLFVTVLIMLGSGIGGALVPTAIRWFLFNFFYFIFISAFFALFAVICGNSGAHFIFSVIGLIFVPAIHSLTIEFLTIGQTNLDTSNLYTDRMFGFESPAAFYFKISKNMISAGTGRFLEMMARTLGLSLEEMSTKGLEWKENVVISSMCTVFAESEVVSLVAQNKNVADIIHGLNVSVASKVGALAARLGKNNPGEYMMTGGVAKNKGITNALEEKLGAKLYICDEAQLCGALGAALFAYEKCKKGE